MKYVLKTDPRSSHQLITHYLTANTDKKRASVLDLGCAGGHIGALLPEDRFVLTGTDSDRTYADMLPPIYRAFHAFDLNSTRWPVKGTFDIIVMADVLEHLISPEHVLKKVQLLLRPKGMLIISLPNYEFIIARIVTSLGIVPRHDRGIFDRTHLHYFTRNEALALFTTSHYAATYITSTTVPLSLIFPFLAETSIGTMLYAIASRLTEVYPSVFGYQNIFVCHNKGKR